MPTLLDKPLLEALLAAGKALRELLNRLAEWTPSDKHSYEAKVKLEDRVSLTKILIGELWKQATSPAKVDNGAKKK